MRIGADGGNQSDSIEKFQPNHLPVSLKKRKNFDGKKQYDPLLCLNAAR